MGLLISVSANVDEHFVPAGPEEKVFINFSIYPLKSALAPIEIIFSPSIKPPSLASTALPVAAVPRILLRFDMEVIDMVHQVL